MIKCVFFDFDGVLRNWDYDERRFKELYGVPIEAFREVAFAKERVGEAVRGVVTSEEWRAGVGEELKKNHNNDQVGAAIADWNIRTGQIVPEVLEIVKACKQLLPVALMTNATTRLPWELEQLGLVGFFDYVINASEIGYAKPEPEIYAYALKLVGISPDEAFFTDDGLAQSQAATDLGCVGHHFKNPDGLRRALVDAGVL